MMRPLTLACCFITISAQAQYLINNFDGNNGWEELPIVVDTAASNTWQTGAPQKVLFTASYSPVNAIVTDTLDPAPAANTSSFTALLPTWNWGMWPEFFIVFQQKFDMDPAHAGGYIEISYDTGATWMNVFDDWVSPPVIQLQSAGGPVEPDTLANGQIGFTGLSGGGATDAEWIWSSFCWVQSGIPLPDTVRMRFTYYADSLAAPRDGWMMDDFEFMVYIAHPISDYLKMDNFLSTAPNPMTDRLYITYDTDGPSTPVRLDVVDLTGRVIRNLVDEQQREGRHNLILWRDQLPRSAGLLLLHAQVGGDRHMATFLVP